MVSWPVFLPTLLLKVREAADTLGSPLETSSLVAALAVCMCAVGWRVRDNW